MKTYCASRSLKIQSRQFDAGEVVGTGDLDKDAFTPAPGLESIVALGHVIPRFADGRIVVEAAAEPEPAGKKARKPKSETQSPEQESKT